MTVQISPSVLAADFARLADEAAAVAGVEIVEKPLITGELRARIDHTIAANC